MFCTKPLHRGLSGLALCLAAAWPLAGLAQGAPLGSFNVDFSGLRLELVDLTPDDGIAPGITFKTHALFGLSASPDGETFSLALNAYANSLLPTGTVSATDGSGIFTTTATPTSFSLRADVSLAQVLAVEPIESPDDTTLVFNLTGESGVAQWVNDRPVPGEFTLAPNTKVILHGAIQASNTLDGASLNEWLSGSGYAGYKALATPFFAASAQFQQLDAIPGDFTEGDNAGVLLFSDGDATLNLSDTDSLPRVTKVPETMPFDISFENPGNSAFDGHFSLFSVISPTISLSLTKQLVPETGTWALMGLGLVGMALVRRRQQPR